MFLIYFEDCNIIKTKLEIVKYLTNIIWYSNFESKCSILILWILRQISNYHSTQMSLIPGLLNKRQLKIWSLPPVHSILWFQWLEKEEGEKFGMLKIRKENILLLKSFFQVPGFKRLLFRNFKIWSMHSMRRCWKLKTFSLTEMILMGTFAIRCPFWSMETWIILFCLVSFLMKMKALSIEMSFTWICLFKL